MNFSIGGIHSLGNLAQDDKSGVVEFISTGGKRDDAVGRSELHVGVKSGLRNRVVQEIEIGGFTGERNCVDIGLCVVVHS